MSWSPFPMGDLQVRIMKSRHKEAQPGGSAAIITIFVLENTELGDFSIRKIIETDPKRNKKVVGSARQNTSSLVRQMKALRPDIFIADLHLGGSQRRDRPKVYDGLDACRKIRDAFGTDIGIIAMSMYGPELARAKRSDIPKVVLDKNTLSVNGFRRIIDKVAKDPEPWEEVGKIKGLELFPSRKAILLVGTRRKTPEVYIDPSPFRLLLYLAKERMSGGSGWLIRKTPRSDNIYQITNPTEWKEVCKMVPVRDPPPTQEYLAAGELSGVAVHVAKINGPVGQHIDQGSERLIKVPGQKGNTYSLNPDIKAADVRISP